MRAWFLSAVLQGRVAVSIQDSCSCMRATVHVSKALAAQVNRGLMGSEACVLGHVSNSGAARLKICSAPSF